MRSAYPYLLAIRNEEKWKEVLTSKKSILKESELTYGKAKKSLPFLDGILHDICKDLNSLQERFFHIDVVMLDRALFRENGFIMVGESYLEKIGRKPDELRYVCQMGYSLLLPVKGEVMAYVYRPSLSIAYEFSDYIHAAVEDNALPSHAQLSVSDRCNLKCSMCPFHSDTADAQVKSFYKKFRAQASDATMETKVFSAIVDGITRDFNIKGYTLTGCGEPFMNKDLLHYGEMLVKKGKQWNITTNGLLLSKRTIDEMMGHPPHSISFSIDAATPGTYYKIRGKEEYKRLEENIYYLLSQRKGGRPIVQTTFTIQGANRHEAERFVGQWLTRVDSVAVWQENYLLGFKEKEMFFNQFKRTMCLEPLQSLYFPSDATLSPCCTLMALASYETDARVLRKSWKKAVLPFIERSLSEGALSEYCRRCELPSSHTKIIVMNENVTKFMSPRGYVVRKNGIT